MCDACVINAVKDRMLSRRAFFGTAAGAGAAGPASCPAWEQAASNRLAVMAVVVSNIRNM